MNKIKNIKMRSRTLITTVLLLLSMISMGQIDSLHKSLLQKALENNQQIKKAQLEAESYKYKVKEVRSAFLPGINASLDVKDYLEQPVSIIPGELFGMDEDVEGTLGKPHTLDAGFTVSQLVFSAQTLQSFKTVKSTQKLYELKKIQTEEDIIYHVSKAYYYLLITYENLNVLEENLKLLEHNKTITQRFIENEMAIQTDLARIQLKITETENQINITKSGIYEQLQNLKLLVGTDDISIPEDFGIIQHRRDHIYNESIDVTNRIDFKTLMQAQIINDYQLQSEKAKLYPTVSIYGNYMYNAQRDEFNYFDSGEKWNNISLIGLKLSFPIFSGFKTNATIQQAKINQNITSLNIEYAEFAYNKEYHVSLHKLELYRNNRDAMYENTRLAQEIYNKSLLRYQEGILPLTDLLDAETDLSNTKLNYLKSELDVYTAELDVHKTSGEIKTILSN